MNTMALYLIGDLQGCDSALQRLLDHISFSPSRDTLFFLGDLVNRGPDSAGVLRRLMALGDAAQCVLGNHDLHLLATSVGARKPGRKDTLAQVLQAPDAPVMLDWLRHQRLAMSLKHADQTYLMVHAGVQPTWSAKKTIALAQEVEAVLQSPSMAEFLHQMYGNTPTRWSDELRGMARLRVIVNTLTRMRYLSLDGEMDLESTEGLSATPANHCAWFDMPERKTSKIVVAFGHWSTLGWLDRSDVFALDSGCVWGGKLSALKLGESAKDDHTLTQVSCEQSQQPGD